LIMKRILQQDRVRPLVLLLLLACAFAMISTPSAFAIEIIPPTVSATYDSGAGTITMEGSHQEAGVLNYPVVLEVLRPDGSLLYFATQGLDEEYAFELTIAVAPLSAGTYTVRMASYGGGDYTTATFAVAQSGGSGRSSSSSPVIATPSSDPTAYYDDIPNSMGWAVNAINGLTEQKIVAGIGDRAYGPALPIRRGDFILMLMNAYALDGEPASLFTDVPADSYYGNAIALARGLGIAVGDGERFRPQESLTRQDAMALLHRAMVKKGVALPEGTSADLTGFLDAGDVSAYAGSAIASLVKSGIVQGDGTRLYPHSTITRAEMAVMLWKALEIQE